MYYVSIFEYNNCCTNNDDPIIFLAFKAATSKRTLYGFLSRILFEKTDVKYTKEDFDAVFNGNYNQFIYQGDDMEGYYINVTTCEEYECEIALDSCGRRELVKLS